MLIKKTINIFLVAAMLGSLLEYAKPPVVYAMHPGDYVYTETNTDHIQPELEIEDVGVCVDEEASIDDGFRYYEEFTINDDDSIFAEVGTTEAYTSTDDKKDEDYAYMAASAETDFSYTVSGDNATITGYSGPGGAVVIPAELDGYAVVSIAATAFRYNTTLTSVEIPDTVTSLGNDAFYNCAELASLTIPSGLTANVGYNVFQGCTNLSEVMITRSADPDRRSVGTRAFYDTYLTWPSITKVIIEEGITDIGYQAFSRCTALTDISIPPSVASIGSEAFFNCKEFAYPIPLNLTSIGSYAFYGTGVTSVEIPATVASLGNLAFCNCAELASLTIPSGLTANVGFDVFRGCTKLSEVMITSSEDPDRRTVGTNAFYDTYLTWPSITKVVIEEGITAIGYRAFRDCTALTDISIPSSVTSIDHYAFFNCKEFTYPIPLNLTSIGSYAFSGTGVTSVEIPDTVTSLGNLAFYNCAELASLTIPSGLTANVGFDVFRGCTKLSEVTITSSEDPDRRIVGTNAFYDTYLTWPSITKVVIEEGITAIGYRAFCDCTALTDISIPPSVASIGSEAFFNCKEFVYPIPPNLTSIGSYAFSGTGIKSVEIPDTVTSLGNDAFYNCTSLASLTIPSGLTANVFTNIFSSSVNLSEVTITPSMDPTKRSVGASAFYSNYATSRPSLTKVVIEEGITAVGDSAFRECTGLVRVEIPFSVDSIGNNTFLGSNNVVIYGFQDSYAEAYAEARSLPFLYLVSNATTLDVSLPAPSSPGQYSNMAIALYSIAAGTTFSVNVTDKLSYTFRGLTIGDTYKLTLKNRYGYAISEIDSVFLEDKENSVAFTDLLTTKTVSLKVLDSVGADVTAQCTVQWHNDRGDFLAQGSAISDIAVGASIQCRVGLDKTLGSLYMNPSAADHTVTAGDNIIVATLAPIPTVTVSGIVKNAQSGAALSGAAVSISQMLNGKYPKTTVVSTGADGAFTAQVLNDASTITVSSGNFFNQVISKSGFSGNENLGEISLSPISGAVVALSMSYTYSAEPDAAPFTTTLPPDYVNLSFAAHNQTQDKAIANVIYQYPYLILPEGAGAGDTVQVTVTGGSGDFNPVHANATLGDALEATVTLDMVQQGSIKMAFASSANDENAALVFNSSGKLAKEYDFRFTSIDTDPLPDGSYTVVFMGKSRFFDSVQNLTGLSAAGLVQGVDYASSQIELASGVIKRIDSVSIPRFDESKFYYTDNDKTLFSANKTSAVAGSYFTLRSQLAFKEIYQNQASDVKLIVQLPDDCIFVENSVIYGTNSAFAGYMFDDGMLTVPLANAEDIVRFCVIPARGGGYAPNSFVEFTLGGDTIRQPIGAASFEVTEMKINVPEKTGQKWVTVTGATLPGSEVIVYDNGSEVGRTQPLLSGEWRLTVDLIKPYSYSKHQIYAEVILPEGAKISSEIKLLTRIESYIELSKVTMINTAHGSGSLALLSYYSEFDFINPSPTPPTYWFWPNYPAFTFVVEFTNNDPTLISDVRVNAFAASGSATVLPAAYDSEKRVWIATGNFNSYNAPVNVGVDYISDANNEIILDDDLLQDLELVFNEANTSDNISFEEIATSFTDMSNGLGEFIGKCSITDSDGVYDFYCSTSRKTIDDALLLNIISDANKLEESSFFSVKDSNGSTYYYAFESSDKEAKLAEVNALDKTITTVSFFTSGVELSIGGIGYNLADLPSDISTISDIIEKIGGEELLPGKASTGIGIASTLRDITNAGIDAYERQKLIDELKAKDKSGMFTDILNSLEQRTNNAAKVEIFLAVSGNFGLAADISSRFVSSVFSYATQDIDNRITRVEQGMWVANNCALSPFEQEIALLYAGGGYLTGLKSTFNDVMDSCKARNPSEGQNARVVMDPSGYVYEAVASNRLPGVTATAFYKTVEEDMYGDEHEVVKVWDASEYGQQNPLTTNELGWYEWDVPFGLWQVKYEKDGYQTAYSTDVYGWLPVPPPQLEVHMGLVSYAQPNVARVNGYEEYIEAAFDRYMDIETIGAASVSVSRNGEPAGITIGFADEEADPAEGSRHYARVVRIMPAVGRFDMGDEITLTIKKGASTYAGVQMAADFTQAVPIKPEPKQLVLPGEINLGYGEARQVEVSILPAEAGDGKTIKAVSGSSFLVGVDAEATADAQGKAVFTVVGELSGETEIEFSVDGTLIRQSVAVNVALPNQETAAKADKPTANLASGEVERGTLLTLSTTTPGATIFYTLDGSCPCADGGPRQVYNGPIEINEDMMILAAAYKDGMDYSDTLGLYFIVKSQGGAAAVTGEIRTYNPGNSTTIRLMQGGEEKHRAMIESALGIGQATQGFTIEGVAPGTYTLVVTKPGHTSFTVQTVVVGGEDVDLAEDSRPEVRLMALRCGDVNGDGMINSADLAILWQSSNFNKSVAQAAEPLCDLNGDGMVNSADIAILWLEANFNKGAVSVS